MGSVVMGQVFSWIETEKPEKKSLKSLLTGRSPGGT
jgi:hypothetical protein